MQLFFEKEACYLCHFNRSNKKEAGRADFVNSLQTIKPETKTRLRLYLVLVLVVNILKYFEPLAGMLPSTLLVL